MQNSLVGILNFRWVGICNRLPVPVKVVVGQGAALQIIPDAWQALVRDNFSTSKQDLVVDEAFVPYLLAAYLPMVYVT